MRMGHAFIGTSVLSVVVVLTAWAAATQPRQGQASEHQSQHSQAAPTATPEIFCLAKPTGQQCTHGSGDVLKLDGAKRQRWIEVANRYNKTVDAATKQLLEEAQRTLSPEEFATVEKWFAKSLNAQLNRQLLGDQR